MDVFLTVSVICLSQVHSGMHSHVSSPLWFSKEQKSPRERAAEKQIPTWYHTEHKLPGEV